MRQPIRTRSGCWCCRRRRKKCDEQKPACAACLRLGLQCMWNNPTATRSTGIISPFWTAFTGSGRTHTSHVQQVIGLHRPLTLYAPFADDFQHNLFQKWPACCSALFLPDAPVEPATLRAFLVAALREDFVRPALATFTIYVLFIQGKSGISSQRILGMYQKAVRKLVEVMNTSYPAPSDLALLIAASMLGITEVRTQTSCLNQVICSLQ